MHRYFFWLVAACVLSLAGCRTPQTVKDAWKGTRSYYYEYLNTPATLNLDDKGNVRDYQAALGAAIADFDMHIQELERALQNSDQNPDAAWVSALTSRFPWLSGVALTDEDGIARAKIPPEFPKPFDISPLLEVDPKQQIKDLRAYVQEDPLGPEIYVGNPVYVGADFRGVITVHFDPRTLLARTADAAQIMIAGPDGILWPGMYDAEATPMAGVNWGERVRHDISGVERNEAGAFYWICRYVGNLPLIYAIRIQGDFPLREENMQGLAVANSLAIGPIDLSMLQGPAEHQGVPEETDQGTPPAEIAPDGRNSPLQEPADPQKTEQDGTPLSE
ncbi:MAG: hypothetical protein LIP28_04765 [Deltaproteobacteria bacterium]|nr:hypothetical protein [Deltaproteobacteria bacterium]